MSDITIRLLTIAVLCSFALSACGQGCLRCNPTSDTCTLCDFASSYVADARGNCVLKTVEKCQVLGLGGECLQCPTGYFADAVGGCSLVPAGSLIANCEFYSEKLACRSCAQGFYLSNGACLAVAYEISGCRVYASANRCAECDAGSVLHPSRNRCVAVSSATCLMQNNVRCEACAPGFALDPNYFVAGLFAQSSAASAAAFVLDAAVRGRNYGSVATPCRPLTIANCASYESFGVCKKCADNYFLASKGARCTAFPHPALPNCENYTYYNSCSQCSQGYLLAGTSDCLPVRPIAKCARYSQTSAANVCVECVSGYFVSGNTCNDRRNLVAGCAQYRPAEDSCGACAAGMDLTSDSRACLASVSNCATYQSSNLSTSALICQVCNDTFFYNSGTNTCEVGRIDNCRQYQNNSGTACQVCLQGYYIEGGQCKKHKEIVKCARYSEVVPNACTACDNTSLLYLQGIGCSPIVSQLDGCVEYGSPSECKTCAQRFVLTAGRCEAIPAAERCLVKSVANQCTQCEAGYLVVGGVCKVPMAAQQVNCEEIQDDGRANAYVCNRCAKNTVPFNFRDTYVCTANASLAFTLVPSCNKYSTASGTPRCVGCVAGKFVSQAGTCVDVVSETPNSAIVLNYSDLRTSLDNNYYAVNVSYDLYTEVAADLRSCSHVVYTNVFESGKYAQRCLKCKSGLVPSVVVGNHKSHINPSASNPATFAPVLGFAYNTYTCSAAPGATYYPASASSAAGNCESFLVSGGNVYCKACKRGFTGKVDVANAVSYQFCNVAIADCNAGTTIGGLIFDSSNTNAKTDLMVHLSCHACYSPGKIPVVFGHSNGSIAPFGLAYSTNSAATETVKNDVSVQCLDLSRASLKFRPEQYTAKPVRNCGVAKYNVDAEKRFANYDSYAAAPIVCAACKPGFVPVRSGADGVIVRCDAIANCDGSSAAQWFNNCAKCQAGYTWFYDLSARKIDFSKCVPSADQFCLATTGSASLATNTLGLPASTCFMCAPGYSYNLDGACEKLEAPLCSAGAFSKGSLAYNANMTNMDTLNLLSANSNGCQACSGEYTAVSTSADFFACTSSAYVLAGDFPANTAYVANCKHYSTTGATVMCRECAENYIPSGNGRFCVEQDVYPNCERANGASDKCETCQSGYVLVNGYCEKPTIQQCTSYDSANVSYQRCTGCIDGYKLVSNQCVLGHVASCRLYDNSETCLSCYDRYVLVQLAGNAQKCLAINADLNCTQMSSPLLNNALNLQCGKCNAGFAPTSSSAHINAYVCQDITPVDNCDLYDVSLSPANSTLACLKCKSAFYLRNNRCIARLVTTANCSTYSQVDDLCAECAAGFYLSNERECVAFPTGIFGCVAYSDEKTCTGCDKGMYLSGNTCAYVTAPIGKCAYYKDASTCAQCEFNYFLQGAACVKAKALNCASYSRIDRCASCPAGFGLRQTAATGVVDCVHIANQNCRQSEGVFPFFCKECSALFYNDNGRCMAVETAIANCDAYNSPVTCARCLPTHVLSLDARHCLSSEESGVAPYSQCVDNKLTKKPACAVCPVGSRFVGGVCTACANMTKASGCMFCDGDSDASCVLCLPGYYMDKSGKCFLNSAAPSALMADFASR